MNNVFVVEYVLSAKLLHFNRKSHERQYETLMGYVDAQVRKVVSLVQARSSLNIFLEYGKRQAMHDCHFLRNTCTHVFYVVSSVPYKNQNQFTTNTCNQTIVSWISMISEKESKHDISNRSITGSDTEAVAEGIDLISL